MYQTGISLIIDKLMNAKISNNDYFHKEEDQNLHINLVFKQENDNFLTSIKNIETENENQKSYFDEEIDHISVNHLNSFFMDNSKYSFNNSPNKDFDHLDHEYFEDNYHSKCDTIPESNDKCTFLKTSNIEDNQITILYDLNKSTLKHQFGIKSSNENQDQDQDQDQDLIDNNNKYKQEFFNNIIQASSSNNLMNCSNNIVNWQNMNSSKFEYGHISEKNKPLCEICNKLRKNDCPQVILTKNTISKKNTTLKKKQKKSSQRKLKFNNFERKEMSECSFSNEIENDNYLPIPENNDQYINIFNNSHTNFASTESKPNFNTRDIFTFSKNIREFSSSILNNNGNNNFEQNCGNIMENNGINENLNNKFKEKKLSKEICEICLSSFKNRSTKIRHYKKEHMKIKIIPELILLNNEDEINNEEPILKEKMLATKRSKTFATDGVSLYSKINDQITFKKERKYEGNLYSSCIYDINGNKGLKSREIIENNQIELSSTQLPKCLKKVAHFLSYFELSGFCRPKTEKFNNENITKAFYTLCQSLQSKPELSKSELLLYLKPGKNNFCREFFHQLNYDREAFMTNLAKHEKNISVDRAIICFLNNNIDIYSDVSSIILIFSMMIFREFVNMKMINAYEEKNSKLIEHLNDKLQIHDVNRSKLSNLETFRNKRDIYNSVTNNASISMSRCRSPIYISPIKEKRLNKVDDYENSINCSKINFNESYTEISSLGPSPTPTEKTFQQNQMNRNPIEDFICKDILLNQIESVHKRNIADLFLFFNHNSKKSELYLTTNISCNSLPFYVIFFSKYLYEIEKKEDIFTSINELIKDSCSNLIQDSVSIESDDIFDSYEECDFLYSKEKTYKSKSLIKNESIMLNRETILTFITFFMSWLKANKYTVFELNPTDLVIENKQKDVKKFNIPSI